MLTSRQSILEYIREKGNATASDISRLFHMTPANARRHLAILHEQGALVVSGQRPAYGRGRPSHTYSPAGLHSLNHLVHALLHTLLEIPGMPNIETSLHNVASHLAEQTAPTIAPHNPTLRLSQVVARLKTLGYQARWEAHADGPRLIFSNCPYISIINHCPELCRMDCYLIQILSGSPAEMSACLESAPQGSRECRFKIGWQPYTSYSGP